MTNRMYDDTVTWNPFKGCEWDCTYCVPSFQRLAKMQKCEDCKSYTPHTHRERLDRIPKGGDMLFVCSSGDICFCDHECTWSIICAIKDDPRTVLFQTKSPAFWSLFIPGLPENVLLGITLETNRDEGYEKISKAPPPVARWTAFYRLNWPRKAVTIEPVMDFDLGVFSERIIDLRPEVVWIGYNSTRYAAPIPEPPAWKVNALIYELRQAEIEVRPKDLRGLEIPND
ncbi:hypothetical protein LCGC14_2135770 [marine sediment metagenome]|uniref:DUF5131 family protein n=1 Tax=marine sediment metagenome TaxID=412755 RepID=A0A0F9GW88_9ZZZZ